MQISGIGLCKAVKEMKFIFIALTLLIKYKFPAYQNQTAQKVKKLFF